MTATIVTKLELHTSDLSQHLAWLARLMMHSIESEGVISAEIFNTASSDKNEWILVQRFCSADQIEAWRNSDKRHQLMDELKPEVDRKKVTLSESIDSTYGTLGCVTVAVATHVKEGQEKQYINLEMKYQAAQARMPGYRGAYVQPPTKGTKGIWTSLIRFNSPKEMDMWFASDERKTLVDESDQIVSATEFQNITTSFPGWFKKEVGSTEGPPNWKTAILILLGLYPCVMLVLIYLLPYLEHYHLALKNFIGNSLSVAFTTWVSMPIFIKVYKPWLFPTKTTPKWVKPLSIISILVLLTIEVVFFWKFF